VQYGMTCMRHGFFGSPTTRKVLANEQIAPSGAFLFVRNGAPQAAIPKKRFGAGGTYTGKAVFKNKRHIILFTYVNINKMPAEVSCRHEKFSLERNGVLP